MENFTGFINLLRKILPAIQKKRSKWLFLLFFFIFVQSSFSETARKEADDTAEEKSSAADKLDLSRKSRLSDEELKKKKEDGYFTFIAGPASSPDTGFGGTAVVFYYWNGKKDDILFPYTPYLHNLGFLVSYQSKGYTSIAVAWDAPYFLHTPFRVYADLWFNINPVSQYYGTGSQSLQPLTSPDGLTFQKMTDYDNHIRQISSGITNAYYNNYYSRWFDGRLMVQRDFGGGVYRVLGGYLVKQYYIEDYSFRNIEVTSNDGLHSTTAKMQESLLLKDEKSGRLNGFQGGWANGVMLGVAYDTRDYEPNPRKGMFHDLTFTAHPQWLGSVYEYYEATLGSRFYYSPFEKTDLVIAARAAISYKFGNVPFFALTTMQFTDQNLNSIGGMRGYRDRRFMGPFSTLANLEIRYTFLSWKWGEQLFALSIAPFLDMISVFDSPEKFSFNDWKFGYGAGIRLTWNQATVIRFDFGFSEEDFGFYLMIKHLY